MAWYPGFCGPSRPSVATVASIERTMNLYPERAEVPTGTILLPTPGFLPLQTVSETNTRALFSMAAGSGRSTFAVIGGGFYELFQNNLSTRWGSVAQDNNLATISYSGIAGGQLFITSGGNGYCFTLATNTLTQVLTGEATMGGFKDGYFLAFNVTNGKVRISNANDGTTWPALNDFQRSIAPDPWVAMVVSNPEIWMIGEQTSEPWYNAGTYPQPFAPILSGFTPVGTTAPWSCTLVNGSPVLVGRAAQGGTNIIQIGNPPKTLSSYAVSALLASFERSATLNDAESFSYLSDGHTFVVVNFPTANATWVVDMDTGEWHERGTWNPSQGRYDVWHPRTYAYAFGQHLIGERGTGRISDMNTTVGTESDGSAIRRLRIPPPLWADVPNPAALRRLDLLMDVGLGLQSGQGSDPTVMLRVSTDARTWSQERTCSAGAAGEYATNVFWSRLGRFTKVFVPEITVSDPVPWRWVGAIYQGSGILSGTAAPVS